MRFTFMLSHPKKTVKILVVDYDECSFSLMNERKDGLSPELIKIAKKNNYRGFYGGTHRCYRSLRITSFISNYMQLNQEREKQNENSIFTHIITKNFAEATGLSCFAVSTPDDFSDAASKAPSEQQCGLGYEKILKPWEEEILLLDKKNTLEKKPYVLPDAKDQSYSIQLKPFEKVSNNKNQQLLSIARDASFKFPDSNIEIDFFDDREDFCSSISQIPLDKLPLNTSIRSFRHCPALGIIASIEKPLQIIGHTQHKNGFPSRKNDDEILRHLLLIKITCEQLLDAHLQKRKTSCRCLTKLFQAADLPPTVDLLPTQSLRIVAEEHKLDVKNGMKISEFLNHLNSIEKTIVRHPSVSVWRG
jgi:hypothetical protein